MYAQVVHSKNAPKKRAEMDRIVREKLLPALRDEPGCSGALSLVHPETGDAVMIVLWESAEHARRPIRGYGRRVLDALGEVAAISTVRTHGASPWSVTARV